MINLPAHKNAPGNPSCSGEQIAVVFTEERKEITSASHTQARQDCNKIDITKSETSFVIITDSKPTNIARIHPTKKSIEYTVIPTLRLFTFNQQSPLPPPTHRYSLTVKKEQDEAERLKGCMSAALMFCTCLVLGCRVRGFGLGIMVYGWG